MDVINGGAENNHAWLSPLSTASGQAWSVTDLPEHPGHVSLTTDFRGQSMALEGHSGTTGNRPVLQPLYPFTSQAWLLTPLFSVNPALATPFGTACRGRGGVPALQLTGGTGAWLGENMTGEVTNVLAGTASQLIIGSRLANPIDLAFISSPGCLLRVDPVVMLNNLVGGGRAIFTLPIPNSVPLVGQLLPIQASVIDLNHGVGNPLMAMTNGLELRFGLR